MAMNIISKEKKEIKWIGLPTNSAQECQNLEVGHYLACSVCPCRLAPALLFLSAASGPACASGPGPGHVDQACPVPVSDWTRPLPPDGAEWAVRPARALQTLAVGGRRSDSPGCELWSSHLTLFLKRMARCRK